MRYIITRASQFEKSPHPDAIKVVGHTYKDARTFKTKEEWLAKFPEDAVNALQWGVAKNGNPFRIVASIQIYYEIEISDLIEFVRNNGPVVLTVNDDNMPEIEIYDDYRE
jgi:hypothetical protein